MNAAVEWPDDLRLASLIECRPGWRAYIQDPHGGFLQGAFAATPQAAVDLAVASYRASRALERTYTHSFTREALANALDLIGEL